MVSGLASAGIHVYTLGPLPTNGLAMLTKKMRANLGIMITASHNPYYDNGLKLFGPDGLKLSDNIEKKIERLIDSKIIKNLLKIYLGLMILKKDWAEQYQLHCTACCKVFKFLEFMMLMRSIKALKYLKV